MRSNSPAAQKFWEQAQELEAALHLARTQREKREIVRVFEETKWVAASKDPYFFVTELATTLDEHDQKNPYKPLPDKRFIQILVEEWVAGPDVLLIPKSRQMHVSWIMALLHLHHALTHEGRLILFQSKKEEDAAKLIERCAGIYRRLPACVQRAAPCEILSGKMIFKSRDCIIQGIPQGAHQIRMNVPSLVLADEMAFQEEAEEAFIATLPAIEGGGRFTGVSSAAPSFMEALCTEGILPQTHRTLLKPSWRMTNGPEGVTKWETQMGITVVQLHHSADPRKNEAWRRKESKKYPGGIQGKGWRAEQDIDWGAKQGGRVYPAFTRESHVIDPFPIPDSWVIFRGVDPGYHNPCAILWVAMDGDGCLYVFEEFYESQRTVKECASRMKAITGRMDIEWTIGDPSIVHKTQAAGGESLQTLFAEQGIHIHPGNNRVEDGVQAVAERLRLRENGEPLLKVFSSCLHFIAEIEGYRYKELSEEEKRRKNVPEVPLKRNDHLMDALRYIVMNLPADYFGKLGRVDPYTHDQIVTSLSQRARARMRQLQVAARSEQDWMDE